MANDSQPDALDGIPFLGPTRRARLAAAGYGDPASLGKTTAEEVARVAQMPRGQAEQVVEAARANAAGASPAPALAQPPPAAIPVNADADSLAEQVTRARSAVDAVLANPTLGRRVSRPLAGFAGTLERLAAVGEIRLETAEGRARVVRQLERITRRLEDAAAAKAKDEALGKQQAERLRERLVLARMRLRESLRPRYLAGTSRGKR